MCQQQRERYLCSITFDAAVPLCIPCVMQVKRKKDLAALQFAMTWREETVPAGVRYVLVPLFCSSVVNYKGSGPPGRPRP